MNSLTRILAGCTLGFLAAASAAAFEGKVSLGMKSGRDAEQVIDYAMKGTRVRMEPKMADAGGAAMIMDWEKQEMIVLMPEQQMYMVMPLRKPQAAAHTQPAAATEQKVEKTGRTEKILGYRCEEYVTSEGGQTTELWITEELGPFAGLGAGANPMAGMMGGGGPKSAAPSTWERALQNKQGAFPLRVISRDAKGRETFRLEAKKIEPGTLPDSHFAPPSGYQKFALPTMPGFSG